jgi:hypothetical protein
VPDLAHWSVFLAATIILLVIPGPSVLFVVARGIDQGFRAALLSSVGLAFGDLFQVLCAAVGLSALLASSIMLFITVKYAGAALSHISRHPTGFGERCSVGSRCATEAAFIQRIASTLARSAGFLCERSQSKDCVVLLGAPAAIRCSDRRTGVTSDSRFW